MINCFSFKKVSEKKQDVLIYRDRRGLGDILMHRMIFQDISKTYNSKVHFACLPEYHKYIKDHPYVEKVFDIKDIDRWSYRFMFDTSNCCIEHESKFSPYSSGLHRAEIWAEQCNTSLKDVNMFLDSMISEKIINEAKEILKRLSQGRETVLFCPFAFDKLRSLLPHQIEWVLKHLKNYFVFVTHTEKSNLLTKLRVPQIVNLDHERWLSLIMIADWVITVDTSVFHFAGGCKKPMLGIFTHVDGKTRGKFFDFVLVQKHRDNGDWMCGPCYNYSDCCHPKCISKDYFTPKPCLTELTEEEICSGIDEMFNKFSLKK